MAAKTTSPNARVYNKIGDELLLATGVGLPDATADITAFRALADMTNAGALLFEIDGTDYVIPLLTNS